MGHFKSLQEKLLKTLVLFGINSCETHNMAAEEIFGCCDNNQASYKWRQKGLLYYFEGLSKLHTVIEVS